MFLGSLCFYKTNFQKHITTQIPHPQYNCGFPSPDYSEFGFVT